MTEGSTFGTPLRSGRPLQSPSSSTFRAMAPALSTSRRRPSSSIRPDDATPTRFPTTNRRLQSGVRLGDVLVDLAGHEARQAARRAAATSASASVAPAAVAMATARSAIASQSCVWSVIVVGPPWSGGAGHLSTPTCTSRNRAPETAWPMWPSLAGLALAAVRGAEHTHSRYRAGSRRAGRWRRRCGRSRRVRSGTGPRSCL